MALWAIADLHLSLGEDKPMQVFRGWENYVSRIESAWRSLVEEDDTVAIAGDISWAMKLENTTLDFAFLQSLPGKKILLRGNHDYWWNTLSKMNKFIEASGFTTVSMLMNNAYRVGDIAVCGSRGYSLDCPEDEKYIIAREAGRLELSLQSASKLGGEPVVFLHYPPVTAAGAIEPFVELMHKYGVRQCYYGHLHSSSQAHAVQGEVDGIHYRLIAADYTSFAPVPVKNIEI